MTFRCSEASGHFPGLYGRRTGDRSCHLKSRAFALIIPGIVGTALLAAPPRPRPGYARVGHAAHTGHSSLSLSERNTANPRHPSPLPPLAATAVVFAVRYNRVMEDQDDCVPQDEQQIRDRIDDELVNRDLLERLDAGSRPLRGQTPEPPGNFWRLALSQ